MSLGMTYQLKIKTKVIYPMKPLLKVNNAGKLLSFPNGLCLYNGGTHTGILLLNNQWITFSLSYDWKMSMNIKDFGNFYLTY